jgi:hypothetical protein
MHLSFTRPRALLIAAAVAAGSVAVANAATPANGTVSKAAPKTAWTGTLAESAIAYNAFNQGQPVPCETPTCDSFALTVADAGADLVLNIKPPGDVATGFRITYPDGKQEFDGADATEAKGHTITIKNAAKGEYILDAVNAFFGSPGDYSATAELRFGGAAPAPAAEPTATPGSGGSGSGASGAPGTPGAPAQPGAQTAKLTIKAGKQSAKKLKKKKSFVATVTSNEAVTKVNVVLAKGAKQVGAGTLAQLNGSGKVKIKLKGKPKPGKYSMSVGAYDAQGRSVVATTKVTIKK